MTDWLATRVTDRVPGATYEEVKRALDWMWEKSARPNRSLGTEYPSRELRTTPWLKRHVKKKDTTPREIGSLTKKWLVTISVTEGI